LPWENDAIDGTVLEEEFFQRFVVLRRFFGGRPLGLGGIVGIFFAGGGYKFS